MTIPDPTEFWPLNTTRAGINGCPLFRFGGGSNKFVSGGVIGNAWDINNIGDDALFSNNPTIDLSASFSLSVWHKFTRDSGSTTTLFYLYKDFIGSNYLRLYISYSLSNIVIEWRSYSIAYYGGINFPHDWHHYCVSISPTKGSLYIDGYEYNTCGASTNAPINPTKLTLGGECAGGVVTNQADLIDSVGWWNVALSVSEVEELYNYGSGWEPSEVGSLYSIDGTNITKNGVAHVKTPSGTQKLTTAEQDVNNDDIDNNISGRFYDVTYYDGDR